MEESQWKTGCMGLASTTDKWRWLQFSSVQLLSYVWLFVTPWTAAHQASLSTINSGACSNSWPSSQWCHPTISSSVIPFSSCLQSCPASESSLLSQFFASGGQSIKSFSISISSSNEYPGLISFRIGSPRSLTDSQESSPIPQFKSINSLVPSFLYRPTLTSIHDHWKNHSLD